MTPAVTIPRLQTFLGLVQRCFPHAEAIIAGGAVRDTLNGRPVKDIDVFLCEEGDYQPGIEALGEALYCQGEGVGLDDLPGYISAMGYGGPRKGGAIDGAFFVYNFENGIGLDHPAQLIFLSCSPVLNLHETFDFDISQAWVTRHRVWTTSACREAMLNRRIRYCPKRTPNAQQRQSSRERLERLKVKYAGWHFDCPIPKELA